MADVETATETAPAPIEAPVDSQDAATSTAVTTVNAEGKKVKRIVKKKRPARPQVDGANFKSEPPPQTGTIFNIWYNKWAGGDREDKYLSKTAAPSRCSIRRDSGYTLADKTRGSFFCLYFARGLCPKGRDCQYLHRLPTLTDFFSGNVDCFGRERHSDYRDDMGGVGSFLRQNRTIYVGRIHVTDDIEEVVARHFQEWGEIDRVRVLPTRGVGFVTYVNEANAQFAKEAMAHQALDHSEVLNVRWATQDPNPLAQKREARRIEEQAAEAIKAALPPEYVAELEGRDPEAKKRRKIEGGFGLQGYDAPDDVWYAKEKGEWEAGVGQGQLEAGGEDETRRITEHGEGEQRPNGDTENQRDDGQGESSGGLLSGATLKALQGRTLQVKKDVVAVPSGPLVGYGSDDSD